MFYQRPYQFDYGYSYDFYGGQGFNKPYQSFYRQQNRFAITLVLFILCDYWMP